MKDAFVGLNYQTLMNILTPEDREAIKIHLSQSAVQEFYKRHVKPICEKDMLSSVKEEADHVVRKALREAGFLDRGTYTNSWSLPPDIKEELTKKVKSTAHDVAYSTYVETVPFIKDQLDRQITSFLATSKFQEVLESAVKRKIESLVNDQLKSWFAPKES